MLKEPKKLKFLERIFHFLRHVLDIYDRCRYFSSSEPVNYHFLVSFQVVIQMYDGDGEIYNSNQKPIYTRIFTRTSLREKCPYSELFWSLFFHVWTGYARILRISPYSVLMWQNTDQNNSEDGHFLRRELI